MNVVGVVSGDFGQPVDGALAYARQPRGLPDAAMILKMPENVQGLFRRKPYVVKGRALPLGKSPAADLADQNTNGFLSVGPSFLSKVSLPFLAIEGTSGVLTTKRFHRPHVDKRPLVNRLHTPSLYRVPTIHCRIAATLPHQNGLFKNSPAKRDTRDGLSPDVLREFPPLGWAQLETSIIPACLHGETDTPT